VNRIEASRQIDRPPAAVYETLETITNYPAYSKHLETVSHESAAEDRYRFHFAWWRLTYSITTRVVEREPPNRLDWETISTLSARGAWIVEERSDSGSTVTFSVTYDPSSVDAGTVSLPFGISMEWVAGKVATLATEEANRVLDRIAQDLESVSDPAR
jgi:uncharacterized membrane protein